MNFHIMTLFPEMVMNGLSTSIIGRAVNRGLLSVEAVNIRDYAFNKHGSVDDYPYGGGAGMLIQGAGRKDTQPERAGRDGRGKETAGRLPLAPGQDIFPAYGGGIRKGR